MRPPDLPGGNTQTFFVRQPFLGRASMRPPDLPGGNLLQHEVTVRPFSASMRPPDLPGGNKRMLRHSPSLFCWLQ